MIINGNEAKEFYKDYYIDTKANIYHYKNGNYVLRALRIENDKNKQYPKQYIYIKGKKFYVHRVYAYVFMKEYKDKDIVIILDYNKPISVDNLRIVEFKEKDEVQECCVCNNKFMHKNLRKGMCVKCFNTKYNMHQYRKNKLSSDIAILNFVYNNFKLSNKQRLLVEMFNEGKTPNEIAKTLGVSKQAVSEKKIRLLNKYKCYIETQQVKEKLKNKQL